jgi:hypothetical protein
MNNQPMLASEHAPIWWAECPACGTVMVEGESVSIEGPNAIQQVSCLACDAHWTEVYHALYKVMADG